MVIDQNEWFEENVKLNSISPSCSSSINPNQNIIEEVDSNQESPRNIFTQDDPLAFMKKTKDDKKLNRRFSGLSASFMEKSKRSFKVVDSRRDSKIQSKRNLRSDSKYLGSCSDEMINSLRNIIKSKRRISGYNNKGLFPISNFSARNFLGSSRLVKDTSANVSDTNIINTIKSKNIINEQLSENNSVSSTPKKLRINDIENTGVFKENDNELIHYKRKSSSKKSQSYDFEEIKEIIDKKNDLIPLLNKTQDMNSKQTESDIHNGFSRAPDLFSPIPSNKEIATKIKTSKIKTNLAMTPRENNKKIETEQEFPWKSTKRISIIHEEKYESVNLKADDCSNINKSSKLDNLEKNYNFFSFSEQQKIDQLKKTPISSAKNVRKGKNLLDVLHDMGKNKVQPIIDIEMPSFDNKTGQKNDEQEIQSDLSEIEKTPFLTKQHPISSEMIGSDKILNNTLSFKEKKNESNISILKKKQDSKLYINQSSSENSDDETNQKKKIIKTSINLIKKNELLQSNESLNALFLGLTSLLNPANQMRDKNREKGIKSTTPKENKQYNKGSKPITPKENKELRTGHFSQYKVYASYVSRKQKKKLIENKKNIETVPRAEIQSKQNLDLINQSSQIKKKADQQNKLKERPQNTKITPSGMLLKGLKPDKQENDGSSNNIQIKTSDNNIKTPLQETPDGEYKSPKNQINIEIKSDKNIIDPYKDIYETIGNLKTKPLKQKVFDNLLLQSNKE